MWSLREFILTPKFLFGVSIFISGFTFGSNWGRERMIVLEPKKRCYLSKIDGDFNCVDWGGGNVVGKRDQYIPTFFKKPPDEVIYWIDWGVLNPDTHVLGNISNQDRDVLFQRLDVLMGIKNQSKPII